MSNKSVITTCLYGSEKSFVGIWIEVYRGGELSMTLQIGDVLDAEPVLPGFKLPVEELFGWLKP